MQYNFAGQFYGSIIMTINMDIAMFKTMSRKRFQAIHSENRKVSAKESEA